MFIIMLVSVIVGSSTLKGATMPEHRCSNVGAFTCNGHFKAETKDELMRQVARHLREEHNVKTPTQTLMNYVAKMATKTK